MSMKKVEKPVTRMARSFLGQAAGPQEAQRVFWGQEVSQGYQQGNHRANSGGQPGPKDTHIQHKDKKVVPKDVEDTPGQDGRRRPAGVSVISEKGGQHLVKQKDRHYPLDRKKIGLGQGEQRLVSPEQGEKGGVQ